MSVDLMGMLKDAVSKQVMDKIGGMIGLDAPSTNKAFEGAAGSILGGLMKKSTTQQGIDQIFGVAKDHDGGLFDNIGDLLGNQDATEKLQKQGGGILDMVFGNDRAQTENAVGQSLGVSSGIVGKLMSLAGPMLMGVIGRYVKNKALNAVGLGSLLGDQGSYLGNYMPAGLANNLGIGSFLGNAGNTVTNAANSVGNAASGAVGSVGNAASSAGRAASNTAGQAADAGGGLLKALLPLALLAAIGWGLWQFVLSPMMNGQNPVAAVGDGISDAASAVGDGVSGAAGAVGDGVSGAVGAVGDAAGAVGDGVAGAVGGIEMPKLELPGMDLSGFDMSALGANGPKLTQGMTDISNGFQGLATGGEEAANGLVGKITGFGDTLGDMNIGSMEGPAKTAATGILGQFSGVLEGLLSKVPESLQGIVRPAVEGLIEKISGFAG